MRRKAGEFCSGGLREEEEFGKMGCILGLFFPLKILRGILSQYCCTCIVHYSVQRMLLSTIPLPQCN